MHFTNKRDERLVGFAFVLVTTCGWGLNWPVIKFLLREWPPLFARGSAGVIAAVLLAGTALARGQSLRVPPGAWPTLAARAFTNVFAWMGFSALALKYLPVAEAALLVYTMPIWATLLAWPMRGTRPALRDGVALTLGLLGTVFLFANQAFEFGDRKLIGMGFALAAAVLFAVGALTSDRPAPLGSVAVTAWQLGLACAPMAGLGIIFEHPHLAALTARGAAALAYMTVGPMALCYLAWFAALRRLHPATAAMATLLVPIVASVAAALLLNEPLRLRQAAAGVLILAGVVLALRRTRAT